MKTKTNPRSSLEDYEKSEILFSIKKDLREELKNSMSYDLKILFCRKSKKYSFDKNEDYFICICGMHVCSSCLNICHQGCLENVEKINYNYKIYNELVYEYKSTCNCNHPKDDLEITRYGDKIPCFISMYFSGNLSKTYNYYKNKTESNQLLCEFCFNNCISKKQKEHDFQTVDFGGDQNHKNYIDESENSNTIIIHSNNIKEESTKKTFSFEMCSCSLNHSISFNDILQNMIPKINTFNENYFHSTELKMFEIDKELTNFKNKFKNLIQDSVTSKALIEKVEMLMYTMIYEYTDKKRARQIFDFCVKKLEDKEEIFFCEEKVNVVLSYIMNFYSRKCFQKAKKIKRNTINNIPFKKRFKIYCHNKIKLKSDLKDILGIEILEKIIDNLFDMRQYAIKLGNILNVPFLIHFIKNLFELYCLNIRHLDLIFNKLKKLNFKSNDYQFNELIISEIDEIFYIYKIYATDYDLFKKNVNLDSKFITQEINGADNLDLYFNLMFKINETQTIHNSQVLSNKTNFNPDFVYFNIFINDFFFKMFDYFCLTDEKKFEEIQNSFKSLYKLEKKNFNNVKNFKFNDIDNTLKDIFSSFNTVSFLGIKNEEVEFFNKYLHILQNVIKKKNLKCIKEGDFILKITNDDKNENLNSVDNKEILIYFNKLNFDIRFKKNIGSIFIYMFSCKLFRKTHIDNDINFKELTDFKLFLSLFLYNDHNLNFLLNDLKFFDYIFTNSFNENSFLYYSLENIHFNLKNENFIWKFFYILVKYIFHDDRFNEIKSEYLDKFIITVIDFYYNAFENFDFLDTDNNYKLDFLLRNMNLNLIYFFLKITKLVLLKNNFISIKPLDYNLNKMSYLQKILSLVYLLFLEKIDLNKYFEIFKVEDKISLKNTKMDFEITYISKLINPNQEYLDKNQKIRCLEENCTFHYYKMIKDRANEFNDDKENTSDDFNKPIYSFNKINITHVQILMLDILSYFELFSDFNLITKILFENITTFKTFLLDYASFYEKTKDNVTISNKLLIKIIKFLVCFILSKKVDFSKINVIQDTDLTDEDFKNISFIDDNIDINKKFDFENFPQNFISKYKLNKIKIKILDILKEFIKKITEESHPLFKHKYISEFIILKFSFILKDYRTKRDSNRLNKFINEKYLELLQAINIYINKIYPKDLFKKIKKITDIDNVYKCLKANITDIFASENFDTIQKNMEFYTNESSVYEYLKFYFYFDTRKSSQYVKEIRNYFKFKNKVEKNLNKELELKDERYIKFGEFIYKFWTNIISKFIETKSSKYNQESEIFECIRIKFTQEMGLIKSFDDSTRYTDLVLKENFIKLLNFLNHILYYSSSNIQSILNDSINDKINDLLLIIIKYNNFSISKAVFEINKKFFSTSKTYFVMMNFILSLKKGIYQGKIVNVLFNDLKEKSSTNDINDFSNSSNITKNKIIIEAHYFNFLLIKKSFDEEYMDYFEDDLIELIHNVFNLYEKKYLKTLFFYDLEDDILVLFNPIENIDIIHFILDCTLKKYFYFFVKLEKNLRKREDDHLKIINDLNISEEDKELKVKIKEVENFEKVFCKDNLKNENIPQFSFKEEIEEDVRLEELLTINNSEDFKKEFFRQLSLIIKSIKKKYIFLEEHFKELNYNFESSDKNFKMGQMFKILKSLLDTVNKFYEICKHFSLYDKNITTIKINKNEYRQFSIQEKETLEYLFESDTFIEVTKSIKAYFRSEQYIELRKNPVKINEVQNTVSNVVNNNNNNKNNFYYHTFVQLKRMLDIFNSCNFNKYLNGGDRLIVNFLYVINILKDSLELYDCEENKPHKRIIHFCFQEIFNIDWIKSSHHLKEDFSCILRKGILKLLIAYLEENFGNEDIGKFIGIVQKKIDSSLIMNEIIKCFESCFGTNKTYLTHQSLLFEYIKSENIYNDQEFELAELYYKFLRIINPIYKELLDKYCVKRKNVAEILSDVYFLEKVSDSIFNMQDQKDINEELNYINANDNEKKDDNFDNKDSNKRRTNLEIEEYFKFLLLIGQEVDICYDNKEDGSSYLERIIYFFKSPRCFWTCSSMIENLNFDAPRENLLSKWDFFMNNVDKFLLNINISFKEKEFLLKYDSIRFSLFYKHFKINFLNVINFIFVLIQNIILLFYFFLPSPMENDGNLEKQMYIYEEYPNSDKMNLTGEKYNTIFFQTIFFSIIQVLLVIVWYFFRFRIEYWNILYDDQENSNYLFNKFSTKAEYSEKAFQNFNEIKKKFANNKEFDKDIDRNKFKMKNLYYSLRALFFNTKMVYISICLFLNILYLITNFKMFLIVQILSIINMNNLFEFFVTAIVSKYKQFISLLIFIYCIEYIFSWIAFLHLQEFMISDYSPREGKITGYTTTELICSTAIECFLNYVHLGLRSGGGIGDTNPRISFKYESFSNYFSKMLYDVSFHIIVNLILANIFFGVIVDTFNEMRDIRDKKENDIFNKCYMCNLDRYQSGVSEDFEVHRKIRHKIQNYAYIIPYLIKKGFHQFSIAEKFVWEQINMKKLDWFPKIKGDSTDIRDDKNDS